MTDVKAIRSKSANAANPNSSSEARCPGASAVPGTGKTVAESFQTYSLAMPEDNLETADGSASDSSSSNADGPTSAGSSVTAGVHKSPAEKEVPSAADTSTDIPKSPIKNKTFFDSIKYALQGVLFAFKTEKNFKYYFGIGIFFFMINLLRHMSPMAHAVYLICCGGVFSSEMLNTSIEHLSNFTTTELHDAIKVTKDIGAAGVVIWGIIFFVVEGVLLWQSF